MTHICISKLSILSSDNGLSPGRRKAIIWTNAWILLFRTLGTNFSEILIKINIFSLKKMYLKMSSGRQQPSCLSLNVLKKKHKKVMAPNKLTYHWSWQLHISLQFLWSLTTSLTEIEPQTAITNQPEESKEKDSNRKEYKESKLPGANAI